MEVRRSARFKVGASETSVFTSHKNSNNALPHTQFDFTSLVWSLYNNFNLLQPNIAYHSKRYVRPNMLKKLNFDAKKYYQLGSLTCHRPRQRITAPAQRCHPRRDSISTLARPDPVFCASPGTGNQRLNTSTVSNGLITHLFNQYK